MNEPLNIQLSTRENVGGAWLKLPATAEQLNAALARIGAQGGDFIISGIETPVPALTRIPLENVQKSGIDELNYLAAALQSRDEKQIAKLTAAIEIMGGIDDIHRLTELTQNTDVYDFHPDIFTHTELGEYTLKHSPFIQIPDELVAAVDIEKLGQLTAASEKGIFTEHGYIVPNGEEWKPINEIPQEYHIAPRIVKPEIDYDVIATRKPAVAVAAAPIVLVSDNPRDKLKEITAKLEAGIKGIFESEQYKSYLKTLSKFHNYSFNNCLLIAMQKPDASHIAGFNAWRDTFKRQVKKGEKGIKILAPAPFKTTKEVDHMDANGKPVFENGKRAKDTVEVTVPAFKVTTVFDVSQTDGEPLPQIGVDELTGSVDRYKDFFAALEKTSPVPVAFEAITGGAKGYYQQEEKRIAINEGMSELQSLKTLIHEIAHSRLHDIDKNAPAAEPRPDRRTREVEAESIAYTVCQHYGLDTSDYSFGYVAGWSGDKQLDALKSSLDTIRKEADAIISEVDKHFAELSQDKTQTAERQPGYEKWSEPATPENAPENPGAPSDDINAYLPQTAQDLQKAKQDLGEEVKATLQFFIDSDMKDHGELRPATLEMIAVQGYEYRESIRKNDVLVPILIRQIDGSMEILSGHNRVNAAKLAGLESVPAIMLEKISDAEAWIYVVETNLMQRSFSDMSHTEKAAVIAVQHSKLFSQGKRNDILAELQTLEGHSEIVEAGTSRQLGEMFHSDELVGTMYSLSSRVVSRYIRINQLIPALKSRLDNGDFAFIPAVTLSFLKEAEQSLLDKCIGENSFTVDMKKADVLRLYSDKGKLNSDSIYEILSGKAGQKPPPNRTPTVKINTAVYARYFKPSQSAKEIQGIVEKALEMYFDQ